MDKKVISTFEKIISVCKEDGCDFVDLSFEDAEQILAMLKPISPTWQQGKAYCGSCGKRIPLKIGARFCHKCGQAVKWK